MEREKIFREITGCCINDAAANEATDRILALFSVSNTEGKLLCEDCNKADRYLVFRACEPCLIKGKYIAK